MTFNVQGFTQAARDQGLSDQEIQAEIARQQGLASQQVAAPATDKLVESGVLPGQQKEDQPQATDLSKLSATARSVMEGVPLNSYTPTKKAEIVDELGAAGLSIPEPEEELSTDQKKRQTILAQASPVISRIVSAGENAETGLLGAIMSQAGKIPGVEGGDAEFLRRDAEGFARLIASAFASEVGVATDKDVNRWLGILPKPGDTLKERRRQSKELVKQVEAESKSLGVPVPEEITALKDQLSKEPEKKDFNDRNFLQKLLSFEATGEFVKKAPSAALEGVLATGKNLQDLAKGDIDSARQRSEKFMEEDEIGTFTFGMFGEGKLAEASREELATKIETVAGIKQLKNILGKKAAITLRPKQAAKKLQEKMLSETKGKTISGDKLVKAATRARKNATASEVKALTKLETTAKELYGGKKITIKDAVKLFRRSQKGKTSAGKIGKTAKAAHDTEILNTLRKEINEVSPTFTKVNNLFKQGYKQAKIAKVAGGTAATAGAFSLLRRLGL